MRFLPMVTATCASACVNVLVCLCMNVCMCLYLLCLFFYLVYKTIVILLAVPERAFAVDGIRTCV